LVARRTQGEGKVRYGLYVPNFGKAAYGRVLADLASDAEDAGWDGFFLWNHLIEGNKRIADPIVTLTAIAVITKRIRFGTTVTALPLHRPWIVARQTATLDEMSKGRLILGVGLGSRPGSEFETFGESSDCKIRAEKLDEGLDVITGLWSGKPFAYQGKHYQVGQTTFIPPSTQRPRIPIWVGGFWPYKAPFRRAAKWDGVIPLILPLGLPQPEDLRNILAYINKHRTDRRPFDVVKIGWTSGVNRKADAKKMVSFVEAGMTWWLESLYGEINSPKEMRKRIRMGPPRLS
jgi:alkanesulfonate monooxygenase SsuD/methylene tetrahydromethanopterin reductase-like flavin-dependent oxidoreductase (luciferase family)